MCIRDRLNWQAHFEAGPGFPICPNFEHGLMFFDMLRFNKKKITMFWGYLKINVHVWSYLFHISCACTFKCYILQTLLHDSWYLNTTDSTSSLLFSMLKHWRYGVNLYSINQSTTYSTQLFTPACHTGKHREHIGIENLFKFKELSRSFS